MIKHLLLAIGLTATTLSAASNTLNYPTGTRGLFLVDKLGSAITFLDPTTHAELLSFPLPLKPHDFVFSADHTRAYVPIYGDGVYNANPNPQREVVVIDLVGRKVVESIDLSPYKSPHGIQIDEQGMLYVTAELDRKLLVVDPKTRKIIAAIDTEGSAHWIALLPDGSKVYVANKDDKRYVSVIDLKKRAIVARPEAPNGTQGIAASPDGTQVVAMDLREPVMIVIDPTSDRVTDRISLQGQKGGAYKAYYSPDGRTLMTMAGSMITIFDARNLRGPQRVLKVGASPMGIAFSADGRTALVANHGDGTVSAVDLAKAEVTKTFKAGTGIETLGFF
jgi:DNA-binding beta-propeller fold protein YncE